MRRLTHEGILLSEFMERGTYAIIAYTNRDNTTCYGIVIRAHDCNELFVLSLDEHLEGARYCAPQSYNSRYVINIRDVVGHMRLTDCLSLHCGSYIAGARIQTESMPTSCQVILNEISRLFSNSSATLVADESESVNETENTDILESYFSNNYSRDYIYRGLHRYHYHQGGGFNQSKRGTSPYLIGVELEVEFTDNDAKDEFCDTPSNWFYRECDGSLSNMGVEIITIPMLPKDIKSVAHWKSFTDSIRQFAKSWDTSTCGLHVHIGRAILGNNEEMQSETIGKMLYFYHQYLKDTPINQRIYGRRTAYNDHDGKCAESDAVKVLGADVLKHKSVREKVKVGAISKSRTTRYFDINIQNAHTIEFRKGKGSLNPERIVAVIEWSELIVQYAKSTPWVNISFEDFINYLRIVKPKSSKIKDILEDYC